METETFKISNPKVKEILLGLHYSDLSDLSPADELELACGLVMMHPQFKEYPMLYDSLLTLSDIIKKERSK